MTRTPDVLPMLRAHEGRGLSLFCGARVGLVLGLSVAVASGCGDNPEREVVIDCEAGQDRYEFYEPVLQNFEAGASWFGFGDCTPGATFDCIPGALDPVPDPMLLPESIPGGRCGTSANALVLRSRGHQDWGSGFGEFQTAQQQATNSLGDGTAWDGIALWARSPGNTTKAVQFSINDINTHPDGGLCLGCESNADCENQMCLPDPLPGRDRNLCTVPTAMFLTDPNHCRPATETSGAGAVCPPDLRSCVLGICTQVECQTDDDCIERDNAAIGGTPFCVDGICAECEEDDDCSSELCGTGVCGSTNSCVFEDGTDEDDTCGPVEVCDGTGPLGYTSAVQTGFIGEASGNPSTLRPGSFCGNSFRRSLEVTDNWELYLLPFDSFAQDPLPSRSPTGLEIMEIYQFGFTVPKEANLELWIDDITFYRRRAADDE